MLLSVWEDPSCLRDAWDTAQSPSSGRPVWTWVAGVQHSGNVHWQLGVGCHQAWARANETLFQGCEGPVRTAVTGLQKATKALLVVPPPSS